MRLASLLIMLALTFNTGCGGGTQPCNPSPPKDDDAKTTEIMLGFAADAARQKDKPTTDQWGTYLRVRFITAEDQPEPAEPDPTLAATVKKSEGKVEIKNWRVHTITCVIVTSAGQDKKFSTTDDLHLEHRVWVKKLEADVYEDGNKVGTVSKVVK